MYPFGRTSRVALGMGQKTVGPRWVRRGVYVINLASVIVIDL